MQSNIPANLSDFLGAQLADCETHWSIGAFGALAEFTRDAGEMAVISSFGLALVTDRGGIRISPLPEMRLVASEGLTRESWSHRVAICIRETDGAMARRVALTEIGPDIEALRDCDRESILFDLGLGALQVDACIRVSDPAIAADLRALTGRNVFEADNPAMSIIVSASPHRVFVSRVGRIEVFQPIPSPNGRSPEGPHTHVLPKLLQHGRTHAATEQIPGGFVPCAHFYPAHPTKDALGRALPFDTTRHVSFQQMLRRFGDKDVVALKHQVMAAVSQGAEPSTLAVPNDRFARASIRIALRQLQAARELSPVLAAWLEAHDRLQAGSTDVDDAEAMDAHA